MLLPIVPAFPADIVGSTGCGLEGAGPIPGGGRHFSLRLHVETSSRARSAFCQTDTLDYLLGGKASRSVSVASRLYLMLAYECLGTAPVSAFIFIPFLVAHRNRLNLDDLLK